MRILYLLSLIYIAFALTSCTTNQSDPRIFQPVTTRPIEPATHHQKKNPLTVSFFTKGQPNVPYKIVGQESISKYNLGGNKRQEANIRDGMRELAAAMGGDAVIDIKHDSKTITGTVVAYLSGKEKNISNG